MPAWRIEFDERAENDLAKLGRPLRRRIIERLDWFTENFVNLTPLPLGAEWKGFFKLRVGDWRIIYQINPEDKFIVVRYIDRRDKVYKHRK